MTERTKKHYTIQNDEHEHLQYVTVWIKVDDRFLQTYGKTLAEAMRRASRAMQSRQMEMRPEPAMTQRGMFAESMT